MRLFVNIKTINCVYVCTSDILEVKFSWAVAQNAENINIVIQCNLASRNQANFASARSVWFGDISAAFYTYDDHLCVEIIATTSCSATCSYIKYMTADVIHYAMCTINVNLLGYTKSSLNNSRADFLRTIWVVQCCWPSQNSAGYHKTVLMLPLKKAANSYSICLTLVQTGKKKQNIFGFLLIF